MNNYGILTKLSLRQYFGLPKDKKARHKKIGLGVLLAACFVPIIALVCISVYAVGGYALAQGKALYILGAIMFISQILVLFFGSATFMAVMYHSKDNEFLNTLPVKPLTIFLSKFTIIYLSNIILSMAILLPSMITIAISGAAANVTLGAQYYIFGLLGTLLTPMVPLLLISIISMPLAYLGRFFKRYQMLSTIVYILMFVAFFVGYMLVMLNMQTGIAGGDGSEVDVAIMMDGVIKTFAIMSKIIYPNLWLASAMVGQKIAINALLYFGLIIVVSALAIFLAAFMYKRNSLRFLEVSFNKNAKEKAFKSQSQVKALIVRDLKLCMRDTSLAINCLLGIILAPLMVGMFVFMGRTMTGGADLLYISAMVYAMGVMMLAGTNYIANIAISREGEKFYMVKYMPISVNDYIKSKRFLSMSYLAIGSVLVTLVGAIATKNWVIAVFLPINAFLFGTAMSEMGIYRDLKNPMLNWISVKQILKQRTSTLIPMLFGMVELIVFVIFAVVLMMLAKIGIWAEILPWAIMTVANVVLMIVFTSRLAQNKNKLFNAIEANNG